MGGTDSAGSPRKFVLPTSGMHEVSWCFYHPTTLWVDLYKELSLHPQGTRWTDLCLVPASLHYCRLLSSLLPPVVQKPFILHFSSWVEDLHPRDELKVGCIRCSATFCPSFSLEWSNTKGIGLCSQQLSSGRVGFTVFSLIFLFFSCRDKSVIDR